MPSEDAKTVKKEEVEDGEGDDNKSLSSIIDGHKKKPTNNGANSAPKSLPKEPRVKKEDSDGYDSDKPIARHKVSKLKKQDNNHIKDEDEDDKPLAKRTSNAKPDKDLKKKPKKEEETKKKKKTAQAKAEQKKREKKVFDLPGQKRDPPEERDPLRIFYGTLYKQVPHSEMALFWMMECGLLSKEEAKKAFEKKQKKSQLQRLGTPTKTASSVKSNKSETVKRITPSFPDSSNKKIKTESQSGSKQVRKRKNEDEDEGSDDSDDDFVVKRLAKKKKAT